MPFAVRADRKLIRAGVRSRRFVAVEVQAPEAAARPGRLPVRLSFALDRSGSMDGEKIRRAREAVLEAIAILRSDDRFAVVAYDDQIETVIPSTPPTPEARAAAARAVDGISARSQTNLCGGWLRACEEAGQGRSDGSLGRCLLLTDGLANVGVTAVQDLVKLAAAALARGVSTSTFGVGADFDEVLLRRMSEAGGGNFHFIETAAQIRDFVASEVGEALTVTAPDAALVVEAGTGVTVESLNDFACRQDGEVWRVDLGSLFSGQIVDVAVGLTFPAGEEGGSRVVRVRIEDRAAAFERREGLTFTWAGQEANEHQPRDRAVDRVVARLYAARAERDALERNRAGDLGGARRQLEDCARRIEGYAGDDGDLRRLVADLKRKAAEFEVALDPLLRKFFYSTAHKSLKGRAMETARRARGPAQSIALFPAAGLAGPVRLAAQHLCATEPGLFPELPLDEDWLAGVLVPFDGPTLQASDEERLVKECVRGAPNAALRIAFTRQRLADNWFSHWHEQERTAVVSLADWGGVFTVPTEAFIAYEVAHHGLRQVGAAWDPESLRHRETRGCLFDLCEERAQIEAKLRSAALCEACRRALEQAGAPVAAIQRLAEAIRGLAVPASVVH